MLFLVSLSEHDFFLDFPEIYDLLELLFFLLFKVHSISQ